MSEPTITCPNCKTEIRLTESLAAPLLAATRAEYERRLPEKDAQSAWKVSTPPDCWTNSSRLLVAPERGYALQVMPPT